MNTRRRSRWIVSLPIIAAFLLPPCLAASAQAGDRVYWANQFGPERFSFANLDGTPGGNLSTAGASIQGVGYAMPFFYLTASLFTGRRAGRNPWGATGLEWQTPSPPPTENFPVTPEVKEDVYDYPNLRIPKETVLV